MNLLCTDDRIQCGSKAKFTCFGTFVSSLHSSVRTRVSLANSTFMLLLSSPGDVLAMIGVGK